MTDCLSELQRCLGPAARRDEPLARYASARVGGLAELFFVARTRDELAGAVDAAERLGVPWRVIGSISNLLVADDGVEGLVIKAGTSDTRVSSPGDDGRPAGEGESLVEAEAGCMYAAVARQMANRGLGGLEWAVNVPGTVGAAVVNNSGAFGSSTDHDLVEALLHLPLQGPRPFSVQELGLAYRTSRLKRGELRGVVLSATYRLQPANADELRGRILEVQRTRRRTQPAGYSLGSMFANPPGDAAGRLIEAAGLKHRRVGDAEVSERHANFILNRGAATARDFLKLMVDVQQTVEKQTGVWLAPEVQFLGRWRDSDLGALTRPQDDAA